ncbi:hypothetical protein LINPERPRIM_LOCUS19019, partial [Linum perenne]
TDYASPDYSKDSSSESDSNGRAKEVDSKAGSNREAFSDARNDDDECDRVRDEEQMVGERGWGFEEYEDPRPDRYPIFCSSRYLDVTEIVIGREFESFAQFKEFCKVNAVKSRRGVKFPINDKPKHDCLVEEDIRAANPAFLVKHYVARFHIDPSWSLRNFIHIVITDFGLKINSMKVYRAKRAILSLIHAAASAVDSQSSAVHPLHQLFCSAAVDLQPAMVGTVDLELDSTRQAKFPHQSSGR